MSNETGLVVIPDVHGHLETLQALLKKLASRQLLSGRKVVFLGDYVDRGPDSSEVLELVYNFVLNGHIALAGNHDLVLHKILEPQDENWDYWVRRWATNYEDGLLASYSVHVKPKTPSDWQEVALELGAVIPKHHQTFLKNLPWFYETKTMILVHAGLKPNISWANQRSELRNKEWGEIGPAQLFSSELAMSAINIAKQKKLITGHAVVSLPMLSKNRVKLNCGVENGGPLVAWISDTNEIVSAP